MGRSRDPRGRGRIDTSRDGGGFVALPWSVLDCPAYGRLSHPARSLLWEIARQIGKDNNGRLLCSKNYLAPRGWTSSDVITRAKRQLIAAGFVHEMVRGCRPNKAAWLAVTWRSLDKLRGYDEGSEASFVRGAYAATAVTTPIARKATREELYERWRAPAGGKNALARPSGGPAPTAIAPPHGLAHPPIAPPDGAIVRLSAPPPGPSGGSPLEPCHLVGAEFGQPVPAG
jgi:hypothetical protein